MTRQNSIRATATETRSCVRRGAALESRRTMSTLSSACVARLNKELRQLEREPPPGVSAWPREGQLNELEAGVCVQKRLPVLLHLLAG